MLPTGRSDQPSYYNTPTPTTPLPCSRRCCRAAMDHPSNGSSFLGAPPPDTPRIGLGLAALGRPGYINLGHSADLTGSSSTSSSKDEEDMRQHCWQVLDGAWALGVRYFDAARSYGRAEEFLGGWLKARGIPPDAVVIGFKWGWVCKCPACAHDEQQQKSLSDGTTLLPAMSGDSAPGLRSCLSMQSSIFCTAGTQRAGRLTQAVHPMRSRSTPQTTWSSKRQKHNSSWVITWTCE